jgi:hypothetical protein
MSELNAHMNSNHPIYWGEVYYPHTPLPDFAWEGYCDGQLLTRKGAVPVGKTRVEGGAYGFLSDFIEADVPTSGWLCSRMGNPAAVAQPCETILRRIVASSGKLLAYINCLDATCPLAELSDGKVTTVAVPTPLQVRVVKFGQMQAVLVWSHWGKSPEWTGSVMTVLALQPPLHKLGELPLQEIDSRDPVQVMNRLGTLDILDDGVQYRGTRVMVDRETAKELSSAAFDERYLITAGGVVRK